MTEEEVITKAVDKKREIAEKFKDQKKDFNYFSLDRFRKMGLTGQDLVEAVGLVDLAIGIGRIMVMQEMNMQKVQHASVDCVGYSS